MATAVAAWPSTINVTNFSDYGEQWDTNFAEFAPDVGPPKRRRRMSLSSETLSPVMYLTSQEVETFRTFYRDTLKDGVLPFTFPKPRTGVIEQYTFSGQGPQVKFVDYGLYQVSMTWRSVPNTRASWLPLLTVTNALIPSLAPDTFADFTTEGSTDPHYWYLGNRYASFATWLAAMGGTFVRAAGSATFFKSGILQSSAAVNVPRFPTDASGIATGLRLCGQGTEKCLWNRDLTNAAWTKTTCTAAKTQVGIDGVTNSASLLTATANNATVTQTITAASAATLAGAWVKRITGTGTIQISQDNGSTKTTIVPTAAWQFFPVTAIQTLTNPVPWIGISVSGDAIAVDFVSVRGPGTAGVVIPDPIATTTATVTQIFDRLSFPFASNLTLTAYLSTVNQLQNGANPRLLNFNDSFNSCIFLNASNGFDWFANGVTVSTIAVTPLNPNKMMVPVSPTTGAFIAEDGVASAPSLTATLAAFTNVQLGPYTSLFDSQSSNGDFKQFAIWSGVAASSADAVRLTT